MTNLLDALYSSAWAITESKLREIEAVLIRHAEGGSLPDAEIENIVQDREQAALPGLTDFERSENQMYLKRGETAYIPMHGTIVSRAGFIDRASGAVSPQSVQEKLRAASRDPQIDRIVLSIDSPGGTVNGTMPTAETVERVAREKEVIAVAENTMASAAYWIGSHASRVVTTHDTTLWVIGESKSSVAWPENDRSSRAVCARSGRMRATHPATGGHRRFSPRVSSSGQETYTTANTIERMNTATVMRIISTPAAPIRARSRDI